MSTSTPRPTAHLADWRFLLPALPAGGFEHLLLAGGSTELADVVLDLGVARRVSTTPAHGDEFDAIVILADATADGPRLLRHLVADGVVYWEVDRRVRGVHRMSPQKAFERLQKAGITPQAAYWVKPWFPDRQMYLPIRARGAFDWYLDTLCRAHTRSRRVLKAAVKAFTSQRSIESYAPCYAVIGTRGVLDQTGLLGHARGVGACSHRPVHSVLLAHGRAPWNRIAMLLFDHRSALPSAVIKSSRTARFNGAVEWEHQVLRELRSTLSPALRRSIPQSSAFRWNGLAVAVESCVPGASLDSRAGANQPDALDDFHLAANWLAAFHLETTVAHVDAREWINRHLLKGVCAEYDRTFGATPAEKRLFAAMTAAADSCAGIQLPLVWQHGDFGPWNIYRTDRELRVIDWEAARQGPAAADLFYLAAHWAEGVTAQLDPAAQIRLLLDVITGVAARDAVGRAIEEEVSAYTKRLDVPHALLPWLLVATFAQQAIDRAHRLRTADPGQPTDGETRRYRAYLAECAAHADVLFATEARHAA